MKLSRPERPRRRDPGRQADESRRDQKAERVSRVRPSSEQSLLWTVTIALFAAGAVMVYSASSATSALQTDGDPLGFLKRYLILGGVGLLLMRYLSRVDLDRVRRATPAVLAVAFGLLVLVKIPGLGVEINGARRWLGYGIARFQPSEVAKLALVLYAAMLIAKDPSRVRSLKTMANPLLLVCGGVVMLIALQPDLGTDLVICAMLGTILLAAGAQTKDLAKLGAGLVVIVLLFSIVEPYRMARLTAFMHPGSDPTGIGFQTEQARIAIGSGGIFGNGLGESVQKVFYLPEAHTDMILAIIGEELGLIGITILVSLYFALIVGGLRAARNSRDAYARLLAIGITSMIACQALLNFFAVMGMAPLTGVPLPFISYGASNLIMLLGAMGLLVNVASGRHVARVRVLNGGGDTTYRGRSSEGERTAKGRGPARQASQRSRPSDRPAERERPAERVASAGGDLWSSVRRTRGNYEDRDRGRGNGGTRRTGPGSR